MPRQWRGSAVVLMAAGWLIAATSSAWAPGTIALDEVMQQLADDEKLIGEIEAQLAAQDVDAGEVICVGARFGGHWKELGGARSVPYACEVGKKKLSIEGRVHLFDQNNNEIDMSDEDAPARAFDYTQTDLTWSWQ